MPIVIYVSVTCWLSVNHAPCHVESHVTQVFMWQSHVDCVNLMSHVGVVSCSNHVSDMSQICQSGQSCGNHVAIVGHVSAMLQSSVTCWSRDDHVCPLLDTCNHMSITSVTCWTHADNINHVSCIHCFLIVSFVSQSRQTRQSCVDCQSCQPCHSRYMLATTLPLYTCWSHSDHVSTMCQSCQSQVCHMFVTCQSGVMHHMLIMWWSRISHVQLCQLLVSHLWQACQLHVMCQVSCWSHVISGNTLAMYHHHVLGSCVDYISCWACANLVSCFLHVTNVSVTCWSFQSCQLCHKCQSCVNLVSCQSHVKCQCSGHMVVSHVDHMSIMLISCQ